MRELQCDLSPSLAFWVKNTELSGIKNAKNKLGFFLREKKRILRSKQVKSIKSQEYMNII